MISFFTSGSKTLNSEELNALFEKYQNDYMKGVRRQHLQEEIQLPDNVLKSVIRWYNRWIDSNFVYKGGHYIAKKNIYFLGSRIADKGSNLSWFVSRGLYWGVDFDPKKGRKYQA